MASLQQYVVVLKVLLGENTKEFLNLRWVRQAQSLPYWQNC